MIKKAIIISVVLFLVFIIGISVYLLIPKSYIVFKTAPEKVFIKIDSKDQRLITNGDRIKVNPGKHKVVVFRDEFNPYIIEVETKNQQTIEIVAVLEGLTDKAKDLLNDDKSSSVIEKFTAQKMDKQVDFITKKYPIIEILPIENRNYTITPCASELYLNNPNKIALCVDIPQEDMKDIVKDDIRSHGFNPEDYEYIWNNYLNGVE